MSGLYDRNQLQDAMDQEFAWRKRELHQLKSMVEGYSKTYNKDMAIRAAVPLLYAHWEGFVKKIGGFYLDFVAHQRLKNEELPDNFLALAVNHHLIKGTVTGDRVEPCLALIDFFRSQPGSRSRVPWRKIIKTRSNLNFDVLHEICMTLGLDSSRFETKKAIIDEKLLARRNHIAHGDDLSIGPDDYVALQQEVFGMMQDFYNQVGNAAFTRAYRRT